MITALMINRNRPRVRMVTGRVTRMSRGFTKKLSTDSTRATTRAVRKRSIVTPVCKTYEERMIAPAVIRILAIKFFMRGEITIYLGIGGMGGLLHKLRF